MVSSRMVAVPRQLQARLLSASRSVAAAQSRRMSSAPGMAEQPDAEHNASQLLQLSCFFRSCQRYKRTEAYAWEDRLQSRRDLSLNGWVLRWGRGAHGAGAPQQQKLVDVLVETSESVKVFIEFRCEV